MTEPLQGSSGSKRKLEVASGGPDPGQLVVQVAGSTRAADMVLGTGPKELAPSLKRIRTRMTVGQLKAAIGALEAAERGERAEIVTGAWNDDAGRLLTAAREALAAAIEKEAAAAARQALEAAYSAVRPARPAAERTGVREARLPAVEGAAAPPVPRSRLTPKDTSARPAVMYMAYTRDDEIGAPGSRRLIQDVAEAGRQRGFTVTVSARTGDSWSGSLLAGVSVVNLDTAVTGWAEDSGEFLADGSIAVPATVSDAAASRSITDGRRARGYVLPPDRSTEAYLAAERSGVSVAQRGKQAEKTALAGVVGCALTTFASHIEGGNLLTGTYASGEPFALVGQDGCAVTRGLVTDRDPRAVIAADTGILADDVFIVEQPGQYHLDMGMLILGRGTVMLNDSMKVLEVLGRHITEVVQVELTRQAALGDMGGSTVQQIALVCADVLGKLQDTLKETARLEEMARASLTAAASEKLRIVRIAGVFPPTAYTPRMNFLNGEIGSDADGAGFLITNGGPKWAEDTVAAQYATISGGLLRFIYFTDPAAAGSSLDNGGGIGCRVKSYSPAPAAAETESASASETEAEQVPVAVPEPARASSGQGPGEPADEQAPTAGTPATTIASGRTGSPPPATTTT